MQVNTQFSVFLVNQPGILANLIDEIAERKMNLIALTIVDLHEQGVGRLVAEKPENIRQVLKDQNLQFTEAKVLMIELQNRPGALARVVRRLADEHVNIEYAYVTSGAPGGKTFGILKVGNLKKAEKVLANGRNQKKGGNGPRKTATGRIGRGGHGRG